MLSTYAFITAYFTNLNERRKSEDGATAVEYGLLVALIAAVIVGIVVTLGDQILGGFTDVSEELSGGGADGTGD